MVALAGVVIVVGLVWVATRGSSPPADASRGAPASSTAPAPHSTTTPPHSTTTAPSRSTVPAARSAVDPSLSVTKLPFTLPAPVSREVVLPLGDGELLVAGGLSATGTSSAALAVLGVGSGSVSADGTLSVPTHDAGGAALHGLAFVFGGGQSSSLATVQAVSLRTVIGEAPGADVTHGTGTGTVVGALPAPRSDEAVAVAGTTAYVIGGYTGTAPDPAVLATTDGVHFQTVATLAVPVRYPAATALSGRLYVFGGEAVGGAQAGQPVDVIQMVDPATHTATVVAHLPHPVEGAAAVDLGGNLYVAGGDTVSTPQAPGATLATVWRFTPSSGQVSSVGHLAVAVSHAGVAVSGTTAWLVGGETGGAVQAVVQRLTLGKG